jgi:hypothetical protein
LLCLKKVRMRERERMMKEWENDNNWPGKKWLIR